MKYKYRASWVACIELYPFESETIKKVIIGFDNVLQKTISYNKETADTKFCDSFEEARVFLMQKHEARIKELEGALQYVKECLQQARELTPDDVKTK